MYEFIINIAETSLSLFTEMSVYLLFGMLVAGILHVFVTKAMVAKQIGKDSFASTVKAAAFGVPLPLCSCGVIPTAVFLKKSGASRSSVISFLISTPQTGVDSIIATYGMMGPVFAVFRPLAALIMGIVGGTAIKTLRLKDNSVSEAFSDEGDEKTIGLRAKINKMFRYSFVEFIDDISSQFVIGLLISALITYFIPDNYFAGSGAEHGIVGMLLMMAVGIPMYVCATASIPIALSLMLKGFSPGAAFVFLVTGPATNAASLAIISKVLGKNIAAAYVGVIAVLSIAFGYLLEFVFSVAGQSPLSAAEMHCGSSMSVSNFSAIEIGGAVFFGILLIMSFYRKFVLPKIKKEVKMEGSTTIKIEGMSCNHCVMNVEKSVKKIEGVESVKVDLAGKKAIVTGNFDPSAVKKSVEDAGYDVVSIE